MSSTFSTDSLYESENTDANSLLRLYKPNKMMKILE